MANQSGMDRYKLYVGVITKARACVTAAVISTTMVLLYCATEIISLHNVRLRPGGALYEKSSSFTQFAQLNKS